MFLVIGPDVGLFNMMLTVFKLLISLGRRFHELIATFK